MELNYSFTCSNIGSFPTKESHAVFEIETVEGAISRYTVRREVSDKDAVYWPRASVHIMDTFAS